MCKGDKRSIDLYLNIMVTEMRHRSKYLICIRGQEDHRSLPQHNGYRYERLEQEKAPAK
jgi:hypothetical protein